MLLLLLTAATYFYFNRQYFLLVRGLGKTPCMRGWFVFCSFILNYLFFFLCSIMEFPLIINWSLFAVFLFFQTLLYNKGDARSALFTTLTGIICGLAVNLLCRSIMAILIDQPLQSFDNHTTSVANLKGIPVCIGFLLAGAVMRFMGLPSLLKKFGEIIGHPKHQSFLLEMMAGLFFYLFLNLLLYSTPSNDLLLKVWSIKSCLFCVTGFYIAIRYTRRICELDDYREKNRSMELELEAKQREEEVLRRQAARDVLTGLYNRQFAEEAMTSMMARNEQFALCFLDLDGLKSVNDRFGHKEGDRYIVTAARQIRLACREDRDIMCRYGGDEFLILFADMGSGPAKKRAETINARLEALKSSGSFAYPLSFSYGVVESTVCSRWNDLIREADRIMYEQKQKKQMARS